MPLKLSFHTFIMDNEYKRYYFETKTCKLFEIVLDIPSNAYKLVVTDKVITCTSTELSWDKPFVLIYPWTNFLKERKRQMFLYDRARTIGEYYYCKGEFRNIPIYGWTYDFTNNDVPQLPEMYEFEKLYTTVRPESFKTKYTMYSSPKYGGNINIDRIKFLQGGGGVNCKTNIEYKINPGDTYTVPQFCELTGASYYPVVTWSPTEDYYINNNTPFDRRFDSVVIKFEDDRQDIPELLIHDNQCIVHITHNSANIECYTYINKNTKFDVQIPWGIFTQSQWLVVSAYAMGLTSFSLDKEAMKYFLGINNEIINIPPTYGCSKLFWPQFLYHRFYIIHTWITSDGYHGNYDMPKFRINKSISNVYNGLNIEYSTGKYYNKLVTIPTYTMLLTMSDNKKYKLCAYVMTSLINFTYKTDNYFLNEITVFKNNEQSNLLIN